MSEGLGADCSGWTSPRASPSPCSANMRNRVIKESHVLRRPTNSERVSACVMCSCTALGVQICEVTWLKALAHGKPLPNVSGKICEQYLADSTTIMLQSFKCVRPRLLPFLQMI